MIPINGYVEELLETPPEQLTDGQKITIRFNSFVQHNYYNKWNWKIDEKIPKNNETHPL